MSEPVTWLLIGSGAFASLGAALNWTWWYIDPRAARMRRLVGHEGARVVYAVLGGGLIGFGMRSLLGAI
jgi:hypothetical protein